MRYRIVKEAAKDEDDTDKFRVETWPEPLCYEKTDRDKVQVQFFAFNPDGYNDLIVYLNDKQTEYKSK